MINRGIFSESGLSHGHIQMLDLGIAKKRRPLNYVSPLVVFFGPWIMFCFIFCLLSLPIHFELEGLVTIFVVVAFILIICIGIWTYIERSVQLRHTYREPSWLPVFFIALLLAWVVGLILGCINYATLTKPYLKLLSMNFYTDIDPLSMKGEQLQDASIVTFRNNSKIDISKAMGFKNVDMYCVAPISLESPSFLATEYNFWFVAKNCCTNYGMHFNCKGSKAVGYGGMRQTDDEDRPFYRLAVQEAESKYGIKASHPIFFDWMENPKEKMNGLRERAFKNCLRGILAYAIFQAFAVVFSMYIL